jgi:hypothetical protein
LSTPGRQPDPPRERSATQVPEARRATVEATRQVWIRKLIDLCDSSSLAYGQVSGTTRVQCNEEETRAAKVDGSIFASEVSGGDSDHTCSASVKVSASLTSLLLITLGGSHVNAVTSALHVAAPKGAISVHHCSPASRFDLRAGWLWEQLNEHTATAHA